MKSCTTRKQKIFFKPICCFLTFPYAFLKYSFIFDLLFGNINKYDTPTVECTQNWENPYRKI